MAIDAKLMKKKGDATRILLRGVDAALLNALRRTIMSRTPVLAIQDVTVYENNSALFDEFLAHRIGLLPIQTDKTYKKGDTVKFTLDKQGPGMVYGKDLACTDPKVAVAAKKTPLVSLAKHQKIKLEATAVMGTGKEHTKFASAIVGYRQVARVEFSKDAAPSEACVKACPVDIIDIKAKKMVVTDTLECTACAACRDYFPEQHIKITNSPDEYVLSVEPMGQYDVKELLDAAVKEMEEKLAEVKKASTTLKA